MREQQIRKDAIKTQNLCLEKHGDKEIYWTGIAENYDSLDKVKRIDGKELKFTWEEVQEKQKVLDGFLAK